VIRDGQAGKKASVLSPKRTRTTLGTFHLLSAGTGAATEPEDSPSEIGGRDRCTSSQEPTSSERGEVPPFVLAEVVGCAVELEAGLDPGGTWSSLTTNAEEMNSNSAGSVYTRGQLEADPRLRRALERWEAGDDSPAAEYERRILIQSGGVPWRDEAAQEQARDSVQHAV